MQTTLRIPDDISDIIATRVRPSRGSVPGYAAELAILGAQLNTAEESEWRLWAQEKIRQRAEQPHAVFAEAQR